MIYEKDLLWNSFLSLKDHPNVLRRLNAADCKWQKTLEDLSRESNEIRVVVAGIQNSGKSTLCNLLVGDYGNQTFQVGDREVTLEVKRGKSGELGVIIVDTPGFGTDAARETPFDDIWGQADVLVYATSVLTGSLGDDASVRENLQKIISRNPGLKERVCIVCTKMANSENAEEIADKNRETAQDLLGRNAPVFLVDSEWYREGILEKEPDLIQASGMQHFLNWLGSRITMPSRRDEIFTQAKKEWLNELGKAKKIIEKSITDTVERRDSLMEKFYQAWMLGLENIYGAWQNCRELKNKLANLEKKLRDLKNG